MSHSLFNQPLRIGDRKVVLFGSRSQPFKTSYWAEDGLICIDDEKHGFTKIKVPVFEERLRAIKDFVRNNAAEMEAKAGISWWPQEEARLRRFLTQGEELCRQATEQGRADLPEVRRHKVMLRRRIHVRVPGDLNNL